MNPESPPEKAFQKAAKVGHELHDKLQNHAQYATTSQWTDYQSLKTWGWEEGDDRHAVDNKQAVKWSKYITQEATGETINEDEDEEYHPDQDEDEEDGGDDEQDQNERDADEDEEISGLMTRSSARRGNGGRGEVVVLLSGSFELMVLRRRR